MTVVESLVAVLGYEIKGEANLKKFDNGLKKVTTSVERLSQKIAKYSMVADKAFGAARTMAIPSAMAILYGKRVKDATLKTVGWNQAFNAITGSVESANKEIAFATDIADRYGASVTGVIDNWVKFKASTKGTDVAKNAREIFKTFTAVSATLGQTPDQLDGALKAIEQMVSKGKVSMEELRQQLGERVYGAFIKSAEAMGVTTQQLDKMVSSGKVVASDLLPKLAKQLQKDYKLDLSKNIESDIATFQRLENSLFFLKVAIGKSGFIDFLADLAEGLTKIVKKFINAPPWIQKTTAAIITLVAASAPLLFLFGSIAKSIAIVLRFGKAIRGIAAAVGIFAASKGGKKMVSFLGFFRKNKGVIKYVRYLSLAFRALSLPVTLAVAAIASLYDLFKMAKGEKSIIKDFTIKVSETDFSALGKKIGESIVNGIFEIVYQLGRLSDYLSDPEFGDSLMKFMGKMIEGLFYAIISLGVAFGKLAGAIFWGVINALFGVDVKAAVSLWISLLIEKMVNAFRSLKSNFFKISDLISEWISEFSFYDLGVSIMTRLFEGLKSIGGTIKSWFAGLVPDWAADFLNKNDVNVKAENLINNLDKTRLNGDMASRVSHNNQSSKVINNNVNIEQNVQQATNAPRELAKASGSSVNDALMRRAQVQVSPVQP